MRIPSFYGPQEPVAQFLGSVFMFAFPGVGRLEEEGLEPEDELLPPVTYCPFLTGARGLTSVFTNNATVFAMPQNRSVISENRNHERFSCTEPSELTYGISRRQQQMNQIDN